MRVLQVIWDGGGNVAIQLPVTSELVRCGHDVLVLGHSCQRPRVEATGAAFTPFRYAPDADASSPDTDLIRDWEARTPIGAFARLRDNLMFGPALEFARDVVAEAERDRPAVIVFDYLLAGAGIGAEAVGVPSVSMIHGVYPLPLRGVPPFGQGLMPARGPLGRLRDVVLARGLARSFAPGLRPVNAARRELGLKPVDDVLEQPTRADLNLVLTSPAFDFAGRAKLPANVRYAGPVLNREAPPEWSSAWPVDDRRPLVLASFSTTFQDQRDLARRVLSALDGIAVRGLLTTGPALDVSGLPVPENVKVVEFAPHAAVLPHARLAITHAGLGTVHAALAAGVPLICIPNGRDQNDNAARVVAAGAGIRLSRRVSSAKLRRAIVRALDDDSLEQGAASLAAAFARENGAARAAGEIEEIAADGRG
jgi:MGT family glycosyltransferase